MRKLYFMMACVFLNFTISAQVINFPDANFKAALLSHDPPIDTNGDGEIEVSEAQSVTGLQINSSNIVSLSGLENFVNLTGIHCSHNQITEIPDFNLAHLNTLDCGYNNITSIHVENSPMLYILSFGFNQVSEIDIQNNHNLNFIECNNNLLSNISLCGTSVAWLTVSGNPNLTTVSVKNNVISGVLQAADPPIGQLDFTNCPLLSSICYDEGEYEAVQYGLSSGSNPTLTTNCNTDCSSLSLDTFEKSLFSLAPNPAGGILNLEMNGNNSIHEVRIYNTLGQLVQSVSSPSGKNVSIDVAQLKTGTYFVEIISDKGKITKKFIKL